MNDSWKSYGPIATSYAALLVCGLATAGMACVTWRAVDTAIDQHAATMATQHHRHVQLVDAIRTLADQAGMLTSADLCPIRFRLRGADGEFVPVFPPVASLESEINGKFTDVIATSATTGGTINFGLHPPGQYRVKVIMDDGMYLQHEFDVLPGVPMDRLVVCPNRTAKADLLRLEVDLPSDLEQHGVLAMCCIEPMPFEHGEWIWHPAPEWDAVYCLVSSSAQQLATSDQFLMKQLAMPPIDLENGLQSADQMLLPSRYCRIRQISFWAFVDKRQEIVPLGTVAFGPEKRDVGVRDSTWSCNSSPPTIEYAGTECQWTVSLPAEVVDELRQRVEDLTTAQDGQHQPADPVSESDHMRGS